jgi:hypothetical protein
MLGVVNVAGFLVVQGHLVLGIIGEVRELIWVFFFHFDWLAFGGFFSLSGSQVLRVLLEAHLDVGFFGFIRLGHRVVTSGGGRAAGGRDTRNLTRASFRAKIAAEGVREGGRGEGGGTGRRGGRRSSSEWPKRPS